MKTFVISLGGSIINPGVINTSFLAKFKDAVNDFIQKTKNRIIIVTGGGGVARTYQDALRSLVTNPDADKLDEIGIRATRVNAELIRSLFNIKQPVIENPVEQSVEFADNNIVVASGWKPGFSTDTDAVYLAIRFNSTMVLNLSNTKGVFTADPRKDKNAHFIDKISWQNFIKMVGDSWDPGLNIPFDPIAAKLAKDNNISVICADGTNIQNTINILSDQKFEGTLIS